MGWYLLVSTEDSPTMIEHLNPKDWLQWLAHNPQALLLDVREPWEIQTASVQVNDQFELLTIPMGRITEKLATIERNRPIACLCHHGVRSLRVAQFLEHSGFDQLTNITGGIHAWALEFDPTVARY